LVRDAGSPHRAYAIDSIVTLSWLWLCVAPWLPTHLDHATPGASWKATVHWQARPVVSAEEQLIRYRALEVASNELAGYGVDLIRYASADEGCAGATAARNEARELCAIVQVDHSSGSAIDRRGVVILGKVSYGWPPRITVYLGAIEAMLSESGNSVDRDDLGVALGRVLTHELLHVVHPEQPHESIGLMRSHWKAEELLGRSSP
jgi:hypothetical protein